MARVQLLVDDSVLRLTLKTLIETDGHEVVTEAPEVTIAADPHAAVEKARHGATLTLATAGQLRQAVDAMREGVFGYLFVPLQPGEATLMIERALHWHNAGGANSTSLRGTTPNGEPLPLEAVESQHIMATLRHCRYNQAEAARLLGIGRNTLWRKRKKIRESEASGSR